MKKGSGTRSGLLWEVERLLSETKELPDILLMENVPQVIGQNNIKDFHMWQDFLVGKGYTNYVQIMNAKDYGVAQNRERCFMVSILGKYNFHFPDTIPLTKTISDYLEDNVDEKYYINSEKAQQLIDKLIGNETSENPSDRTVGIPLEQRLEPNSQGISNTLTSVQKDNMVLEKSVTTAGKDIASTIRSSIHKQGERNILQNIENGLGYEGIVEPTKPKLVGGIGEKWGDKQFRQGDRVYDSDSIAMALTAQPVGNNGGNSYMYLTREPQYRIRKLTPKECWRLMSFSDKDFEKAASKKQNYDWSDFLCN